MKPLKDNQIFILAANSAAIKNVYDEYMEYDEDKINDPAIKKLASYISSTINNEIGTEYDTSIQHDYVIFTKEHTPKNAGIVFYLEATLDKKIALEIIQKARSLAIYIVQKMLPDGDLFQEQQAVSWIGRETAQKLEERQELFLTKWSSSKIADGFSLLDTPESDPLLCVNNEFIKPEKQTSTSTTTDGAGLADGYSYSRNEIYILLIQENSTKTGGIRKFKVAHPDLLSTISEAAFKRLPVRFTARKTTETKSQKSSYTLKTLEIDRTLLDTEGFKLIQ
ncbi:MULTISPECIES: hypothetical protein [Halomonadaceae]|uniref:Uncharacterized protein n=1 Tax=Vreelandella piezotolerans TaxID=2609667 RepID=A0ABQ6X4N7_9GAMM|nr:MULTISPECIES: hypothetical protein [Halomonas]KAE8436996.1 hypothetical protein F1978_16885 [Halomonas piezotolerans]MBR9902413.1 hypothetical protein [Gammaproteobacteria bacterium]QJA22970.1 hypothetical protein GYM47_02015 [Halomonas piezotolerans]